MCLRVSRVFTVTWHSRCGLDAAAAASMISGYRANNGLPAVVLDPELMQLAQAQAEIMAKRDKLDHGAGKPFVQRLKASGYDARTAAENISAGYHTLAEAFSGWRNSSPHRANMLLAGAHPHGHRCGLHASFEIQGLLVADPGRPRTTEGIMTISRRGVLAAGVAGATGLFAGAAHAAEVLARRFGRRRSGYPFAYRSKSPDAGRCPGWLPGPLFLHGRYRRSR